MFRDWIRKIGEINQRYRKPNIEMSRGVKIALLSLRLYLLFLVGLMIYKFVTLLS